MIDREKVIKEYEDYVNSYISLTTSCDYEFEMHKAVLELLKEQEEVVRCKDCKHGEQCNQNHGEFYLCGKDIGTFETAVHKADWFCADGEAKE